MPRLAVLILFYLSACLLPAQVNIWEQMPKAKHVEMTPYLATGDNTVAIVVCPGGSYFWHDMQT